MNYCLDCDCLFDDDEIEVTREGVPYGEGYAYFKVYGCPRCHSSNFEECKTCECCDEWVAESNLKYNEYADKNVCPECYAKFEKMESGGKK